MQCVHCAHKAPKHTDCIEYDKKGKNWFILNMNNWKCRRAINNNNSTVCLCISFCIWLPFIIIKNQTMIWWKTFFASHGNHGEGDDLYRIFWWIERLFGFLSILMHPRTTEPLKLWRGFYSSYFHDELSGTCMLRTFCESSAKNSLCHCIFG